MLQVSLKDGQAFALLGLAFYMQEIELEVRAFTFSDVMCLYNVVAGSYSYRLVLPTFCTFG